MGDRYKERQVCTAKERPFGSVSISGEMAVAMGIDPRPYLSPEEIERQLRITGKTREEWDAARDRIMSQHEAPF